MELDLTKLQAIRKREFKQQRTKTHLLHVFRLHPLLYKKMKVNNRGPFQKEVWARILKPFLFQSSPVSLNLSIKPQSLSLLKDTSSMQSSINSLSTSNKEDSSEPPMIYLYGPIFEETTTEFWVFIQNAPPIEWSILLSTNTVTPDHWIPYYAGYLSPADDTYTTWELPIVVKGKPKQLYLIIVPRTDGYSNLLDSDGDGLSDIEEALVTRTDPMVPDSSSNLDFNHDGQPDFGGLAGNLIADGDEDLDGDGISNAKEIELGSDPLVFDNINQDTDGDGLPDFVEDIIRFHVGITDPDDLDPDPTVDYDNDGVGCLTEWDMGLNPARPDPLLNNSFFFYGIAPDYRRVTPEIAISVSRADPQMDDLAYLHISLINLAGLVGSLTVLKDQDEWGNPTPGKDTFVIQSAYIHSASQPTTWFDELIDNLRPSPEDKELLENLIIRGTSLASDIWEEAKIEDLLQQLSAETLYYLEYRCVYRIWTQFRLLQMIQTGDIPSPGVRLRARTIIARIHTEAMLLREVTLVRGRLLNNAIEKAGRVINAVGWIATVVAAYEDIKSILPPFRDYYRDVRRRCDDNGDSAVILAQALALLADDFAPGSSILAWQTYWLVLSSFDGYGLSCPRE